MLIAVLLFFMGCDMKTVMLTPSVPLLEDGEVFVYMQPFPVQAERLKFSLVELWAVKDDGTRQQLNLSLAEFSGTAMSMQRLMASGQLSPGTYRGFLIKAGKATLRREDEDADLMVPEEPTEIAFPFTVSRRKALLVQMSLTYEKVVAGGFSFSPAFTPVIPEKPLLGLTGYVANRDSHTITVFDKRAGQAAGMIETGIGPAAIAMDPQARQVYVALFGEDEVDVIDMLNNEIIHRIRLNPGDKPQDVVLAPDRRTLLTVNTGSDTVSFLDLSSLSEVNRVKVGNGPRSLIIDRAGRRAFVFNTVSSTISVIDLQKRAVLVNLSTEPGPVRGQFSRKGDRLYVYYENIPYILVFDPVSFSVIKRALVGANVSSLKIDTINDFIYLGKRQDNALEMYDPFSLFPIEFIKTGGGAGYITIDGEGSNLVVVLPQEKRLAIINKTSRKVLSEIDVGEGASQVVLMGEK